MDYFYYVKIWLKEWWDSFQAPTPGPEEPPLTMEQALFEKLRVAHNVIVDVPLKEPLMRHQLNDYRTLAALHAADLLRKIELATVNIENQLSVKSDSAVPKTLRLDDWFVNERNFPVYVSEFYQELIRAVNRFLYVYDARRDQDSWAHYIRKASPYIEDVVVLYDWYLEIYD